MPLIIAQAKKLIASSTSAVTAGYPSSADSIATEPLSGSSSIVIYPPRKKLLKKKKIEEGVVRSEFEDKDVNMGEKTQLLPSSSSLENLHHVKCRGKNHDLGIDIEKASPNDSDPSTVKRNLESFLVSDDGEADGKDRNLPSSKRLNVQLSELEEGEEDEC